MKNEFKSFLAPYMNDMIEYRVSLGYSEKAYRSYLLHLDKFIVSNFSSETQLSRDIIIGWINDDENGSIGQKQRNASVSRLLAEYINSVGGNAYILPRDYIAGKTRFQPYMMTERELTALFERIDSLPNTAQEPMRRSTAAVLFRLIYTCGLRPGEGLRLKRENVDLKTGEVLITQTKMKKDRIVVMSDDMLTLMRKYDVNLSLVYPGMFEREYFFSDRNGNAHTSLWAEKVIRKCFAAANPSIPISELPNIRVYDLRHRFASAVLCKWLDEGENLINMLPYLRTYMGHSTLNQTAYYIHLLPENLIKAKGLHWETINEAIPEVEIWEE